jgi:hypothetical protein
MNGFQNNWILGMGFWGALKLVWFL